MSSRSFVHQAVVNAGLRAAGRLLPTSRGLEFKVIGRLHRLLPRQCSRPWIAGNGFLMDADTSNASYISGVNERRYLDHVAQYIGHAGVVVNVGANTGYTSLYLAAAAANAGKHCQFLALEPEPGTFQMLQRNIALNAFRIEALCLAGGDADTIATFYSTGSGDGAASLDRRLGADCLEWDVPVQRLDAIFADRAEPPVIGFVIDVEGHGGAAMRGSTTTLGSTRPFVAAEIHSDRELDEIEAVLRPLGYQQAECLDGVWGSHRIWVVSAAPSDKAR
jgi:FkbM family methyltransferase